MAVNGRCFSFLEEGLTEGRPGLDISIYTTDSRVVISFEIHFAMQIYQTLGLACRRISDIRTLCHKFPGHLNDPVIKGFKHRQRDEYLTMEIRVADEIFESDLMRQLRKGDQMVNLITNLRQFFADFQPVNDRTQLQGRCRRRTFYDVNRLAGTAAQYGRDWGFSADDIVQQYQAMASKPVLGLKTPKFSAREALDSDEIDSKPQHYTFAESEGSFLVFPEEDLFTPPSQQPPAPGALLSFTGFDQLSLEAHREFEPEIMWAPQYCLDDSNSVDRLEFQPSTPFDNAGFGELTFDDEFCLSSWLA